MNYKAGQDIDTHCTRCKLELAHTVIAAVDGVPARVKCNTCHSERKYRGSKRKAASPAAVRRPKGTAARRNATKQGDTLYERSEKWNALMAKADAGNVSKRDYDMRENFNEGEVILHRKFGGGIVEAVVGDKIRVCFADGERLLIHGR